MILDRLEQVVRSPRLIRHQASVEIALDLADVRLAADLLTSGLPSVERVDLPATAHLPALERPAEVAGLVEGFLGRV